MSGHLCPWWLAYTFDNPLRRILHDPRKLLGPYVREGMAVVDVGCGMGHFSIGMARLVGDAGVVISVDLQQEMLEVLNKRAIKAGVADRIRLHKCERNTIGLNAMVDFALAFYMVHEAPNVDKLFRDIHGILVPDGKLLVVDPKFHVSRESFNKSLESAQHVGFRLLGEPRIPFSLAALLERDHQDSGV